MSIVHSIVRRAARLVAASPLQYWPVTVRAGLAKGARWTLAPFSANWRLGGESEIGSALQLLPRVEGAACWDVGAHFGIHSVGLARQVGASGEVSAFEPDVVAYARLQHHMRMNRLDHVRTFPLAASDRSGELELIVSGGLGSSVTHVRYDDEPQTSATRKVIVRAVRLDDLAGAGEIRLPALVKIDAEGHGGKVLEGARQSLARSKPVVVLSVHSMREWNEARGVLEPLGYAARFGDGSVCGWDDNPGTAVMIIAAG